MNRPVACIRVQECNHFLIAVSYVTAGCCGCLYKCIESNGKSVMCCMLTYAVVKVYGIFSFREDYANSTHRGVCWKQIAPSMSELQ